MYDGSIDSHRYGKGTRLLMRLSLGVLILIFPWTGISPCTATDFDPRIGSVVQDISAESLLVHVDALVSFGTRRADQPGGKRAQDYIKSFFDWLALDEVYLDDFDSGADNVVGVLLGKRYPDRVHVLGAHYDSINRKGPLAPAPGADDNASGTAALLECARAVCALDERPDETIFFVAFAAEELGLVGSRAFVAEMRADDIDTRDMICLDVIGYLKPGTEADLSVSSTVSSPAVTALTATLREVAEVYLPTWRFEKRLECG